MPKSVDRSPFAQRIAESNSTANSTNQKRRGRPTDGTEDWAPKFIGAIIRGATIKRAARAAGIDPSMPYIRRHSDEVFKKAWKEASAIGTELLEEEAARRAFHGVSRAIYQKGVRVGYEQVYSDSLLMFILKKRDPTYRDGGGSLTINNDVKVVNLFDDIARDIKLLVSNGAPDSGVPQDRIAEPVDAAQADRAEAQPEAD